MTIIVGAGMAGLLAAGMMRQECEAIYEAQSSLPNNHSAVLRFRSSVVGDALNIPFREVQAIKAVQPWRNPIADAMAYSQKTNGTATMRSILSAEGKPETRYIAPHNLVEQMAFSVACPIRWGVKFAPGDFQNEEQPIISTIPMPALMAALGWWKDHRTEFTARDGMNIVATLEGVDAYCSLYVPSPKLPFARVSITGDQLVAECYGKEACKAAEERSSETALAAAGLLGIRHKAVSEDSIMLHPQPYAKILPINESERREFIMWASETHNVYSLGRFATWRPGLLLDDVVNDVRVIQRLIKDKGASYAHKLKG